MVLPAKFPESQASLHSLHCSVGDYLTCYHTWASYIRAGLHRLTYVATPPPFAVQTGGSHKEAHFMQTQQSSLVLVETLTTAADWAATKIRNSHWFERYRFWICCRFWDVSQPALTVVRIELPGWVPAFVRKGQLLWKPPSWVIRAGNSRNTSPQEEKAPRCETELGMLRNKACMNAWPQDCCMLGLGNSRHWECLGCGETVFQTVYLSEIVIPAPFLDTLFNPGNESEQAFWCWSDSAADLILPCPFFSSYFSSHLVLFSALKVILSQGHSSVRRWPLSEHTDEHPSMTLASTKTRHKQSRHKCQQWISFPSVEPWLCLLLKVLGLVLSSLSFCQQLVFSAGRIQAVKCSSWQVQPAGEVGMIQPLTSFGQTWPLSAEC